MPDPTLDDLRWALRVRADDLVVPVPPLEGVAADVAAHRSRRRRRTGVAVLVAAAVVGLLVAAGVRSDGGARPDPSETPTQERRLRTLEDLKRGPGTDVAYAVDTKLVLGRETITFPQPINNLDQVGDTVVVTVGRSYRVFLVDRRTGDSEELAARSAGSVAIAPDEGAVAWVKAGSATVVLHWLAGAEGENEQSFPAEPGCCGEDFVINGITADGRLIASLPSTNQSWVWDYMRLLLSSPQPGDDVRQIRALGSTHITDVLEDGIVGTDSTGPETIVRRGVLEGDLFRRVIQIDDVQQVYFDGADRALIIGPDGTAVLRDYASGFDRTLPLPPGSEILDTIRETEDTVLLDVSWTDGSAYELSALVRCYVEEPDCEKIANVPVNELLLF